MTLLLRGNGDDVVVIATHYGLDGPGFEPHGARDFLFSIPAQRRSGLHLTSSIKVKGVKRPGRGVGHHLHNTNVQNQYYTSTPLLCFHGMLYSDLDLDCKDLLRISFT